MEKELEYTLFGSQYTSLSQISVLTGIPYSTLSKAVKKENVKRLDEIVEELNPILKMNQPVQYDKRHYYSLQHLCTEYNVSSYKLWMDLKKSGQLTNWVFFFEMLLAEQKMNKPVNNRMGSYKTVYDFCDANMFDKDFFQYLIYKGLDFDSCCVVVSQFNMYRVNYGKERITSVRDLAKVSNRDIYSLLQDLYDGKSVKVGVTKKVNLDEYKPVYKKHTYESMKDLLTTFKLSAKDLKAKIAEGYSFSTALDKLIKGKFKYNIRNRYYKNLDEVSKDVGVTTTRLRNAIAKTSTFEQALIRSTRRLVQFHLYYEEISLERVNRVFNLKENTLKKYISQHGSLYGVMNLLFKREPEQLFCPTPKGSMSLEDLSASLGIPVEYIYFYYKELGATEELYNYLSDYDPTRGTIEVFGKKFKSFNEFRNYYIGDYNPAIKVYNSFEDVVLRNIIFDNIRTRKKVVFYDNTYYESIADFSATFDLSPVTVSGYLKEGVSPEEIISILQDTPEKLDRTYYLDLNVYHKGVYYGKARNLLANTGISEDIFKARMAKNWLIYEAATVPVSDRVVYSGIFEGYKYTSATDLAKHLDIPAQTLIHWYKLYDRDMEKAVAHVRQLKRQYENKTYASNPKPGMKSKILFQGRLYNSLSDIAKTMKVPSDELEILFLSGADLDESIQMLLKKMVKKNGIQYNGAHYRNIKDWAEKERYDVDDVKRREDAGQSSDSIIKILTTVKFSQVTAYDKIFDSVEEAASYFKIDAEMLQHKLNRKYTLQQVVEEERLSKYALFTVENVRFDSIKKAAKALGVSQLTLHRELMRGRSINSILKLVRTKAYAKGKLIPLDSKREFSDKFMVYHGDLYTSLADLKVVVNMNEVELLDCITKANTDKLSLDEVIDTPQL